jgi:hypothetical protein
LQPELQLCATAGRPVRINTNNKGINRAKTAVFRRIREDIPEIISLLIVVLLHSLHFA